MQRMHFVYRFILSCIAFSLLASCASHMQSGNNLSTMQAANNNDGRFEADYASRLPPTMDTGGKKLVLVDPNEHAWGAYDSNGQLVRAGIATAGATICPPDEPDEPTCRTGVGTFRITSIGDGDCYSKKYPRPTGGGLMPYCMFFNEGQALHGSPDPIVIADNVSHGCVRMRIQDSEWMSTQFAQVGTKVVVLPYN